MKLKPCPCGQTPETLIVTPSQSLKYAFVSGDCCNEWHVEFRTDYLDPDDTAYSELAAQAWNERVERKQNESE